MKEKVLFIDRDGTILTEPEDKQIDSLDKFQFVPGAISALKNIKNQLDYKLVLVSNQDGLGTDSFPEDDFWPCQNMMLNILESEGITFDEILIDRSFDADKLPTRKPGTSLITHYLKGHYNLAESFVIGDRDTDVQFAQNIGCGSIQLAENANPKATLACKSWTEIEQFLLRKPRKATVVRNTSETQINISLVLDGTGKANISTSLGFFDHMLEQWAKHGGLDMDIQVTGDTHIDEHHTIEDTALALGQAFKEALGARKGIERYGFLLPMDDCLAQVALDFGGRPWLVWEAEFKREKIGDLPTEMFFHFFKSFTDTAACNLNIKAEGDNEHHKIESIFKATARAIKMAVQRTGSGDIPSSKGVLV